jgi:hypothetical protein
MFGSIFDFVVESVEACGRAVDSVVQTVVIDGIAGTIDDVMDLAHENPVIAVVAVVATGGAACAFAAPLAAAAGGAGLLGASGTGTAMTTLKGVALSNAALAKIGFGTLAAGGTGVAGGTAIITGTGATVGTIGAAKIAKD